MTTDVSLAARQKTPPVAIYSLVPVTQPVGTNEMPCVSVAVVTLGTNLILISSLTLISTNLDLYSIKRCTPSTPEVRS